MKRTSPDIEKQVISEYNNGKSLSKLGESYGLKRNNIQVRTKGGIYKLDEDSIINKYKSGKSCREIAEENGVCLKTICNTLEKNNIARDNIYHNKSLISNYWEEINTYDKAYFLGVFNNRWKCFWE